MAFDLFIFLRLFIIKWFAWFVNNLIQTKHEFRFEQCATRYSSRSLKLFSFSSHLHIVCVSLYRNKYKWKTIQVMTSTSKRLREVISTGTESSQAARLSLSLHGSQRPQTDSMTMKQTVWIIPWRRRRRRRRNIITSTTLWCVTNTRHDADNDQPTHLTLRGLCIRSPAKWLVFSSMAAVCCVPCVYQPISMHLFN